VDGQKSRLLREQPMFVNLQISKLCTSSEFKYGSLKSESYNFKIL